MSASSDPTPVWEIGCKKCGKGGAWKICADAEKKIRIAICGYCDNCVNLENAKIKNQPDPKAYDLRMFT